ncbi:hypothetical protein Agub_g12224, partial [Astrephomene gubernaculifera]
GGGRSGGAGFGVLLTSAADRIRGDASDDGDGSSEEDEEGHEAAMQASWGRFGPALPSASLGPSSSCRGSWGLDGAGALSLHLLAQRVARYFPAAIPPLLDMSGKKHLHTAVVRLPFVSPGLLAHVIQEGLRCGLQLSQEEQARNRVLPATLLVPQPLFRAAAAAVAAAAGGGAAAGEAVSAAAVRPSPSPSPRHVAWQLLLLREEREREGLREGETRGQQQPATAAPAVVPATAAAAAPAPVPSVGGMVAVGGAGAGGGVGRSPLPLLGGALGLLLGRREMNRPTG